MRDYYAEMTRKSPLLTRALEDILFAPNRPRLYAEDAPIVPPPSTLTVDHEHKPLPHLPNGKVLVKRAGF